MTERERTAVEVVGLVTELRKSIERTRRHASEKALGGDWSGVGEGLAVGRYTLQRLASES